MLQRESELFEERVPILNCFFVPCVRQLCARCAPGVRQAWHRWLSALQFDVVKTGGQSRRICFMIF